MGDTREKKINGSVLESQHTNIFEFWKGKIAKFVGEIKETI